MGLQFQYIQAIWLLAAVLVFSLLFIFYLNWKKKTMRKIGDQKLVKALMPGYSPAFTTLKFLLPVLAFVFAVLAFMNLRKPGSDGGGNRRGIDVVIALDVSKSMWAKDVEPSRLDKAKQMINDLVDQMPDNRIGLVLFAGRAYLQMPLTSDHSAAKLFVSAADPAAIPQQGTVLSEAMETAASAFNNKERKFKTVILFSDGEDHDDATITTAMQMAERGVMINTVGIGTEQGAVLPDPQTGEPKKDAMGNIITSKMNPVELEQVASLTNGLYVKPADDNEAASLLVKHLSGIKKESLNDLSLVNYKSFYLWFTIPAFLLLLLELFIPEGKKEVLA